MDINATLLIQIINFYIFYWLLKKLLFRPVITIIDADNTEKAKIIDAIEQQRKSIEIKEKEREHYWYKSREYFELHWPQLADKYTGIFCNREESQEAISECDIHESIDFLVAHVKKELEEKIKHVH